MEKDAVPFLEYLVHHRISKMNLNYEYGKDGNRPVQDDKLNY